MENPQRGNKYRSTRQQIPLNAATKTVERGNKDR